MFLFSKKINLYSFLKIFFFTKIKDELFQKKFSFQNQKLLLFSKSRWSLLFIIFLYKKIYRKKIINIWIPSYFCNYALSKIKEYYKDIKFIYYPVDENLNLYFTELVKINSIHSLDIFINVNYFGIEFQNMNLVNLLNKNKAWLINDCTHCIKADRKFEKNSDFSLYSPHKFYSIPSGAVCKINFTGINRVILNSKITNLNKLKQEFLNEFNLDTFKINILDIYCNLIWFIKRITNIFYKKIKIQDFNDEQQEVKSNIDNKPFPGYFSEKIIKNTIVFDNGIIQERAKTNLLWKICIKNILKDKFDFNFFLENVNLPYTLIIKSQINNTKKIYNYLKNKNIPVSTWPDLPKEISYFKSLHKETFYLRNSLIFINLHPQEKAQLKLIKSFGLDKLQKYNDFNLVEILNNEEWNAYLNKTSFSYVTSVSNYYDSFRFFKNKKFLIKDKYYEKGIFQICYINLGIFVFIRLNFGPSFISFVSDDERRKILENVFVKLFQKKLKIFYVSPNLEFNENNILICRNKNIYSYSGKTWKSITVDLNLNIKLIKKNLKDSLRRDVYRKNREFIVKQSFSDEEFLFFIKNYVYEMKRKNFKGINVQLIKNLFLSKNFLIFNAYKNNKIVSSVGIAIHGNTATYLIGLNIDLNQTANELLLWKIIIFLKRKKFSKFDLGGIDYERNKNVSIFKKNFGGTEYNLVGSKIFIS